MTLNFFVMLLLSLYSIGYQYLNLSNLPRKQD